MTRSETDPPGGSLIPSRDNPDREGETSVNTATFEQLREIGLSVTEAARVLSRRDADGGLEPVKELDELPRFSPEQRASLKRPRLPRSAPRGGEQNLVDLKTATFEELRGIGLSATQAVRVLARRDAVGGFESVDDLDELPGFSPEQRAALKSCVRV